MKMGSIALGVVFLAITIYYFGGKFACETYEWFASNLPNWF